MFLLCTFQKRFLFLLRSPDYFSVLSVDSIDTFYSKEYILFQTKTKNEIQIKKGVGFVKEGSQERKGHERVFLRDLFKREVTDVQEENKGDPLVYPTHIAYGTCSSFRIVLPFITS